MGPARAPARGSGDLNVRIAPLTAADLADARGLAVLAEVPAGTAASWERDLRATSAVLLGAWADQQLVGVATGRIAVDDADVLLVVVAPGERRRGLGRQLTEVLCATLEALGAQRVLLEVRAANTAARALYLSVGFEEVARRRSYYRDGEDALVLARDLASGGGESIPRD